MSNNGQLPKIENLNFELRYSYDQDDKQWRAGLVAKERALVRYTMMCKRAVETKKGAFMQWQADVSRCHTQILRGEPCSDLVVDLTARKAGEAGGCNGSTYKKEQTKVA